MRYIASCRFCPEMITRGEDWVTYGPRHHAHAACFVARPDFAKRYTALLAYPRRVVDAYVTARQAGK